MKSGKILSIVALFLALACGEAGAQSTRTQATRDLMGLGMPGQLAEKVAGLATGLGVVSNNTYVSARNAADSANISVLKVDATDDTILNSDASDTVKIQIGGDANRLFTFDSSADAAQSLTWGDGGTTATQIFTLAASTADADDDATLQLGFASGSRGAGITLPGEEVSGGSDATYNVGPSDTHIFAINGTTELTIDDNLLVLAGAGDIRIGGSGTLSLQEATSGTKCMGTVTANGTTAVPVATTCATTGSRIFLTRSADQTGTTTAACWATNIVNATSFDVDCDAADDGAWHWIIFHEVP